MATKINQPATAFANRSAKRRPRVEEAGRLGFVRKLPCLICNRLGVEAAHVRYASYRHGKRETGAGEKADDRWTVPLCPDHHREQHASGERRWWEAKGIDPLCVAALIDSAYHADNIDGAIQACQSAREIVLWRR